MTKASPLREAFLEDNRKLTRGLLRLLDALKENDLVAARREADRLDQDAGPHMAFEEQVFYPTLDRILGSAFVDQLYHEHAEGQDAVRTVLNREPDHPFADHERQALVEHVETALEHALSCGTLLSHVDVLEAPAKQEMLERLLELRRRGRRWTALGSPTAQPDS